MARRLNPGIQGAPPGSAKFRLGHPRRPARTGTARKARWRAFPKGTFSRFSSPRPGGNLHSRPQTFCFTPSMPGFLLQSRFPGGLYHPADPLVGDLRGQRAVGAQEEPVGAKPPHQLPHFPHKLFPRPAVITPLRLGSPPITAATWGNSALPSSRERGASYTPQFTTSQKSP